MKCLSILSLLLISISLGFAQNPGLPDVKEQSLEAMRTTERINIDGVLDEKIWPTAKTAQNFTQQEPTPDVPSAYDTEVKLAYDNVNLYVAVQMYDDPNEILRQIVDRDDVGNSDWFYIGIDPYGNGTDGFGFLVTAAGGQFDAKLSLQGEDTNWDAVWESAVQENDKGWAIELRIPFSAIRFPDQDVQDWNINFGRVVRRTQEKSWWSPISPQIEGFLNQFGTATGINNIKAPVRLQATPFVNAIHNVAYNPDVTPSKRSATQFSGGMDIKYGISDAFTLDMTLIPDFSQVRSDDQVLNLSPFEVFFNENRPFFTEGTEIFSKGDIFYSRRIGGRPYYRYRLNEFIDSDETIVSTPQTARLMNATKLSGRTNGGLGIGVFNAIERREYATARNIETGKERDVLVNPLSNYNVFVLDQNLPNNSTISLSNALTLREGDAADANVTSLQANIRNKKNTWQFDGSFIYSTRWDEADEQGHLFFIGTRKISGNWRGYASYVEESDKLNTNDLGFLQAPNERTWRVGTNYVQFTPGSFYNRFEIGINARYDRLYSPSKYVSVAGGPEGWLEFKNFWSAGLWIWAQPDGFNDYWEPRQADFSEHFKYPANYNVGGWVNSDRRNRLEFRVEYNYRKYLEEGFNRLNLRLYPSYRFSDQFNLSYGIEFNDWRNNYGWVTNADDSPIIGRRDQLVVNNELFSQYAFTSNMNINLRVRHFWTNVSYDSYYELNDAKLSQTSLDDSYDTSFNSFNIDLIYRWRFRPGSDIFVTYKNAINYGDNSADHTYFSDLTGLFGRAQQNVLSVKMIFFLDYAEIRVGRGQAASQRDRVRY